MRALSVVVRLEQWMQARCLHGALKPTEAALYNRVCLVFS
jgi:hypothetical protein